MAHGLEVYDSTGALSFTSERSSWRWIDSFTVGATESSSRSYPDYGFYSLAIITTPWLESSGGHIFTIAGTTVSWTYFAGSAVFVNTTTPETVVVFGV